MNWNLVHGIRPLELFNPLMLHKKCEKYFENIKIFLTFALQITSFATHTTHSLSRELFFWKKCLIVMSRHSDYGALTTVQVPVALYHRKEKKKKKNEVLLALGFETCLPHFYTSQKFLQLTPFLWGFCLSVLITSKNTLLKNIIIREVKWSQSNCPMGKAELSGGPIIGLAHCSRTLTKQRFQNFDLLRAISHPNWSWA